MKIKAKRLNEKFSVSIKSQTSMHSAPSVFTLNKAAIAIVIIFLVGILAGISYFGINYLTTSKKHILITTELEVTINQQYKSLQLSADKIKNLETYQKEIEKQLDALYLEMIQINEDENDALDYAYIDAMSKKSYPTEISSYTQVKTTKIGSGSVNGTIELAGWFDYGSKVFAKNSKAVIIDVETGLSFNVRRFGGKYHADSEQLTAKDTAIMKKIYGDKWSWDRRAIWVKIGDRYFAASMNGMPHMVNPTHGNNFDGHFCIHFYQSLVHETSRECDRHQKQVMIAFYSAYKLEEYLLTNKY